MKRKRLVAALLWGCLVTTPLVAQPQGKSEPGQTRSEVRLQFLSFENFFNVSAPAPAQTVNALQAEYRGARRLSAQPADVYWHLNFMEYGKSSLQNSYGGRLGLAHAGPVHDYKIYADLAKNRPASAIRNGGTADRGTLYGEYGFRPSSQWHIVLDASHENNRFRNAHNRDDSFNGGEASVHYTGFGYRITPALGVAAGRRDVNEQSQSYRNEDLIAGVEVIPIDPLYFSIAYRRQQRSYDSSPDDASERRGIVELVGDWRAAPRVHVILYYASEDVNSTLPQSDYSTGILILGTSYSF